MNSLTAFDGQSNSKLRYHDARRNVLPVKPKQASQYRIQNGKIQSEACEISVVDHCNLTCRACTHLSPVVKRHNVDPKEVEDDLTLLAQVYHPEHIRLLGGEPLLHPQIINVINAVRHSGISERVRVITNGSLTHRMVPEFWQAVDEVHVSIYPNANVTQKSIEFMEEMAIEHKTELVIKRFDKFRESYSEQGSENQNLIKRIYQTCQIAHVWRCHNVAHGYFYRCPESIFIPQVMNKLSNTSSDRLKIHGGKTFGAELLEFLESGEPLAACSHCLGSVGRLFSHTPAVHSEWRQLQQFPTEDLLDSVFLQHLEIDADAHNGCYMTVNKS